MSEAVFLNALEQAKADLMETFAFIDFDVFPTVHSNVSLAKLRDIVNCACKDQFSAFRCWRKSTNLLKTRLIGPVSVAASPLFNA